MYLDDRRIIKKLEMITQRKFNRVNKISGSNDYSLNDYGRVSSIRICDVMLPGIPKEVFSLSDLEVLRLVNCSVKEIPKEVSNLSKLYWLSVTGSLIRSVPSEIASLKNLRKLNLSVNLLTSIPQEVCSLENLKELLLIHNRISSLPSEIGRLKNLRVLSLKDNHLTSLPTQVGQLKKLILFDLNDNKLTSLPAEIGKLSNLKRLDLTGNRLKTPPQEIAEQGFSGIRDYFAQLKKERGHTQYLFEAKLLIIGDGGTGKTTFLRRVRNPDAQMPKDKDTTRGIEIHKWNFKTLFLVEDKNTQVNFNVNLWDFGGQKLYQGTHQIFFSDKSYYVLVDATREQATDFSYWLNTLQQLAGQDSSVLILLNIKYGHVPTFDHRGYKAHFGDIIKDVFALDLSKDKKELLMLQGMVKNHLKQLPEIGNRLPASWVEIRKDLSNEKSNFISFDRFRSICAKYDITDASMIRTLSGYYTRIGAFTHFLDDPLLRDRIYLNSNWLVKMVYQVLDNNKIQERAGRLTHIEVSSIWKKNALDFEVDRLAQLMNKFGLMYKVAGQDQYVVPEHLPKEQPYDTWPGEGQMLHFVYEFDKYMPPGLMSRIIVSLHRYINDHKLVWHQGVNIELDGAYAEILESYGTENSFMIRIVGENKIELLSVIRDHFEEVLSPFKNLNYDQLVPCSCERCEGTNLPEFHRFKNLQKRVVKENGSQCVRSGKLIPVEDLLQVTIYNKEDEDVQPVVDTSELKVIKVFLASSTELKDDRRNIEIWINRQNKKLVERNFFLHLVLWEDFLDAMSRTRLQDEYNKALLGCDIVVCLFETLLGKFTKEELLVAHNSMKAGNNPRYLYTYFKDTEIKSSDTTEKLSRFVELHTFKEQLKSLGHFPTHYSTISDLKEQLSSQIDKILDKMEDGGGKY